MPMQFRNAFNHHRSVLPSASSCTYSSILRLRVSSRLTVSMRHRNGYRFDLPSASHALHASPRPCARSASSKSRGVSMVPGPAYARSHLPSARAASTSACPAGCMRPSATRAATRSTLRRDQRERGRRGVKRWRKEWASWARRWPSIQPWQRAASTAEA